nr:beta-2 adrenergic receptor-like [Pocillopora verrucosa]
MATLTSQLSSQLPIGVVAFLLAFNIVLSFTASLGNALLLLTFYKLSSLHPATKVLLECLAAIDLCVGLFSQPLFVTALFLYIDLGNTDIDILYYVEEVVCISNYVFFGVILLISTVISVDRLLVLLLRLRYRQVVTLKRTQAVILLCWIIAVLCGLVRVWSQTVSEIVAFVAVVVSLVTSVFCYVKIHLRLQRYPAEVEENPGEGRSIAGEDIGVGKDEAGAITGTTGRGRVRAWTAKGSSKQRLNERVQLNIKQYQKTVSSIFWVQLALVACYTPFIIVSILRHTVLSGSAIHALWLFTKTLVYLNSSLNPFLYCWKITEVRKAVKDTARAFCCCS